MKPADSLETKIIDLTKVDNELNRLAESVGVSLGYLVSNVDDFDHEIVDRIILLLERKIEILKALLKIQKRAHLTVIK